MTNRFVKLFNFFFIFFFIPNAVAVTFEVDGHQIEFSKQRGASEYWVDGKTYKHSGEIKLKKSELFSSSLHRTYENELFILQFETQIFSSYHQDLKKNNIEIVKYIPDHALLVRARRDQILDLKSQAHVKEIFDFGGEYKVVGLPRTLWLQPDIFSQGRFDLLPVSQSDRKELLNYAKNKNLKIQHNGTSSFALTLFASLSQVEELATHPGVLWIEMAPEKIEFDMDIVHIQGGVQTLTQNTGTYQGEGIRGHVLEGIYRDHMDFVDDDFRKAPIFIGDESTSNHGQMTFGIIYGSGAGDPTARGLIPRAQGFYTNSKYVFNKDNRYQLTEELINDHKIMLQTASWGYPVTTDYTARSLEMDKIIFELDMIVTQSQSNRSSRRSRPQAWAKNIISVGAVHHGNNTDFSDDSWGRGGASIGPASDNRIKPDIVSYYDAILTTGKTKYSTFGGTSGATPIINGHLGIIIEMFTNGIFGNKLNHPIENRFANRPHAATAKALLINSARQYDFIGLDHDMTRTHQGWGHPNLQNLYNLKDKIFIVDESELLKSLETKIYEFVVPENTPQLNTTLVYSDPDGVIGAQFHRVNNLDLIVYDPSGQVYFGNNGLYENNFSTPGGIADAINTVENVIIANPMPGTWRFEVLASEVNQDGHLETEDVDADFSLVISGIERP